MASPPQSSDGVFYSPEEADRLIKKLEEFKRLARPRKGINPEKQLKEALRAIKEFGKALKIPDSLDDSEDFSLPPGKSNREFKTKKPF
jgi:hypothetical protein